MKYLGLLIAIVICFMWVTILIVFGDMLGIPMWAQYILGIGGGFLSGCLGGFIDNR